MSRARLYKLFSDRNMTVAGQIRDVRLRRFVDALRMTDEAGIGLLAWTCGFQMRSADFARLFKRVYAMTPREARSVLRAGQQLLPQARPSLR